MNTTLAKHFNKMASHNPKNFRAIAYNRLLEEKAKRWAKTHTFYVGQEAWVDMPNGTSVKASGTEVIDLLIQGWSQYRANN